MRSSRLLMVVVLVLIAFAGQSMLIPNANAQNATLDILDSRENTGASPAHLGEIDWAGVGWCQDCGPGFSLPAADVTETAGSGIEYIPAAGCTFLRWDVTGTATVGDRYSASTSGPTDGESGTLTAVYQGICSAPTPEGPVAPVGGVVMPVNNLMMLSPWLAVIGLVGCIGTAVVVAKKREK